MINLNDIKNFLRLDSDDEDIWIAEILIPAVKIYLHNAGIKSEKAKESELYTLAVQMLVCHWYENRDAVAAGSTTKKIEFSLSSIITQLKYCYENEE